MKLILARRVVLVVVSAIVVLVFWAIYIRHAWTFREIPQIPFVASEWRAAADTGLRTVRSNMIEDLLKSHNFSGWTRAEVEAELGTPSPGKFSPYDLLILVGPDRGFGIDYEFIGFKFDNSGRVSSYELLSL